MVMARRHVGRASWSLTRLEEITVHARLVLWIPALAAVSALAGRPAAAQAPAAPAAPQVTVSGVGYAQFLYQLKDSVGPAPASVSYGKQNQFSVQRAYINAIGKFSGGIQTRITVDIAPSGAPGTNQVVRLKYAYAGWTPGKSLLTYKLGLIHTPWIDFEETLWDYRMQGAVAVDRNGYMTSADFGVGIDGKGKDDVVNGQFTIVNGEGYGGGTGDKRKDVQARASFRLLKTDDNSRVGGLRLSGYVGVGKATGGGDRNRYLGMVSYKSKMATLAAEYVSTKDTLAPIGASPNATGQIISVFGVLRFPKRPVTIIGRVDLVDPNTDVANNKQTRYIAGVSYQVSPNLRVLADVDHLNYEATPTLTQDAQRSRALLQIELKY
jgi:hypothetical protein